MLNPISRLFHQTCVVPNRYLAATLSSENRPRFSGKNVIRDDNCITTGSERHSMLGSRTTDEHIAL
jgi:hypothetical protein